MPQWDGEGVDIVLNEGCSNCDRKPAHGVYFKRAIDQRHIFICDNCGYKRSMGWGVNSHEIMVQKKDGYDRAIENRERWWRESNEKYNQEWDQAFKDMKLAPDSYESLRQTLNPFDN